MSHASALQKLYPELTEDLDEQWYTIFYRLTGNGVSPYAVRAGIEYLTTEKSQQQCGAEFGGVSAEAIRSSAKKIQAQTDDDTPVTPITVNHDTTTISEYARRIAHALDWTQGDEYTNYPTSTTLTAPGARSLVRPLDIETESGCSPLPKSYCVRELADELGWECGEEYGESNSDIYLNKKGWRDIANRIGDESSAPHGTVEKQ
jgi:hypothetical protein